MGDTSESYAMFSDYLEQAREAVDPLAEVVFLTAFQRILTAFQRILTAFQRVVTAFCTRL